MASFSVSPSNASMASRQESIAWPRALTRAGLASRSATEPRGGVTYQCCELVRIVLVDSEVEIVPIERDSFVNLGNNVSNRCHSTSPFTPRMNQAHLAC